MYIHYNGIYYTLIVSCYFLMPLFLLNTVAETRSSISGYNLMTPSPINPDIFLSSSIQW